MAVATHSQTELDEVVRVLRDARRITAICHETPDADTVAAASAMSLIAERLGAEWEIVSADGIPPAFGFLPNVARATRKPVREPDLAVVCDAATLERVGAIAREEADWFARAKLLNIDHHVSNTRFAEVNLVDPQASATCEVVAHLVDRLELTLDARLATALLTGIVRDSRGFADRSTSGETLRMAARMVDAGAPLAMIHRAVLAELPFATMVLWGRMLGTIGQELDGRVVHATLTLDMLEQTGTRQHDADGMAEFLANAKDADVTLLLRELTPNRTRVSARTSQAVDATRVVERYGGGGHRSRAGCTIELPWRDALEDILAAVRSVLGEAAS